MLTCIIGDNMMVPKKFWSVTVYFNVAPLKLDP